MNVLVADDSKPYRESLVHRLSDIPGITTVYEAGSCHETVRLLGKFNPEFLILDLHLGDGSGFDILAELQEKNSKATTMVLTSFAYPQYRDEAMRLGAAYFVEKSNDEVLFDIISGVTKAPNGENLRTFASEV